MCSLSIARADASSTAREVRARAKRSTILDAAIALFRRDGFARATMEEVARTAGVSTATLYRHFPSKTALFEAVAEISLAGLDAAPADLGGDPVSRLRALAHAYAEALSHPTTRSVFRMLVSETGAGGDLAASFYLTIKGRLNDTFCRVLEEGVSAGLLHPPIDGRTDHMAGQLQGMIEHGTLLRGLILGDDADSGMEPRALADAALETWLTRWQAP